MRWTAVGLLAWACGGPAGDDAHTDPAPSVDTWDAHTGASDSDAASEASCALGWGEEAFHPLVDGDEVPVVRGMQGLWHVPGAVRCTGVLPGRSPELLSYGEAGREPAVWWRLHAPGGAFLGGYPAEGDPPLYRPMRTADGPALLDEYLIVFTPTYEDAVDRDAVMRFAVEDRAGTRVEAEVAVRLVAPGTP